MRVVTPTSTSPPIGRAVNSRKKFTFAQESARVSVETLWRRHVLASIAGAG